MSTESDWFHEEGLLIHAVRTCGWTLPVEPGIPGYADWQELRRGGQGVVYKATQLSTRRPVAIKIPSDGPLASRDRLRRFDREADVIAGFQHPHIVRLYDRGLTEQGLPYYVMELIDGCSLDEYLQQPTRGSTGVSRLGACRPPPLSERGAAESLRPGRPNANCRFPTGGRWAACRTTGDDIAAWPLDDALTLFAKVCEAVAYAHAHGVVHRDLKPGNILIGRDGEPHVLDFGLAKSLPEAEPTPSAVSRTGHFMGTLPWASPEQVEGVPDRVDARSDVYSLGVILYQMLTGSFPYPVGGLREAIDSIRLVEPRCPSQLRRNMDGALDVVVLKCLAKDPQDRYQNAAELAGDIRNYLAGEPLAARRESVMGRLSRRLRRQRSATILMAAVVALSGAVLAIGLSWARAERARRFGVKAHPGGLIVVDTAQFGRNVLADLRAGSTLRANTLQDWPLTAELQGSLDLGHADGDGHGRHTVGAGQVLLVDESLRVGIDAPGVLEILAGGAVRSSSGCLGYGIGSRGDALIAGAGATWECAGILHIGNLGLGRLALTDGGRASATELRVGYKTRGDVTVSEAGSAFDAKLVVVGDSIEGTLDISAGGRVSAGATELGLLPGARGTLTIRGQGSEFDNHGDDDFVIGRAGEGLVELDDGAQVSARNYSLGRDATGVGRITIAGVGTRLHSRRMIYVGNSGRGSLEIRDGAVFDAEGVVALDREAIGSVIITGRGATWDAGVAGVVIGAAGTGTLYVRNGGTLMDGTGAMATGYNDRTINAEACAEVVITDEGSLWTNRYLYVGGSPDIDGGVAELTIEQGGAVAVGDVLRLHPRGTLTLRDGTLAVDTLKILSGGTLTLDGGQFCVIAVDGSLLNTGAIVTRLRSPGAISVAGDYVQSAGALLIRLFGTAPDQSDRVEVGGVARLGGDLIVQLCDGFAPTREDRIEILSATRVEGAFVNATPHCALVGGGSCEVVITEQAVLLTRFTGPFSSEPYIENPVVARLPRWEQPTSGPFPGRLSRNTTGESDRRFVGPPDGLGLGIGGQVVEFDFGNRRVVDGPGCDLVVYELVGGSPEFEWFDVLVSGDGEHFVSIKASESPGVRIAGDEQCGDLGFARAYDLALSGLAAVRYVRIDGHGDGRSGSIERFDFDAIGALHHESAEAGPSEPPTTVGSRH